MNELAGKPKLKRPMDPAAMGNDLAMLRALTAQLNDPRLTGAVVPPEEKAAMKNPNLGLAPAELVQATQIPSEVPAGMTAEAAQRLRAQIVLQNAQSMSAIPGAPLTPHERREQTQPKITLSTAPVPASPPTATHQPAQRIFFTGQPFAGKKWLAEKVKARVFGFDDPIRALAASVFGEVAEEPLRHFIKAVRAFGEGSPTEPLTVTRAMFIDYMREGGAEGVMGISVSEFGTPGFWTKSLLARITRFQNDEMVSFEKLRVKQNTETALDALAARNQPRPSIVAVLDLSNTEQYTALREAGFKPYHVACHDSTRAERGAVAASVNPLATQIEQSTIRELSKNPGGKKLWFIWNDTSKPCPSGRLMQLQEFLAAYR